MKVFDFKLEESDRPFLALLKNRNPKLHDVLVRVHSEFIIPVTVTKTLKERNVPYEVVAASLNIPVNTVKSRLSRARCLILKWRNGAKQDGTVQGVQGTEDPTVV